ncbi:MAG: flavin monoamine oxidase family protein [Thermonemataceae bacterium]
MTRQEFIKALTLLGISIPFTNLFANDKPSQKSTFTGNVLIVGAGAAGLSAGYLLKQKGIDFKIIEATNQPGGRMKVNHTFTDFPIPLGAEWITSDNIQFGQLVDTRKVLEKIKTTGYTQNDEYYVWHHGTLLRSTLDTLNYQKFIGSSWLSFFETFIVPSIYDHISYQEPVKSIDYTNDEIVVVSDKDRYTTDRIILTVPLSILQNKEIQLTPALPKEKAKVIENTAVWPGFKAFFEFEEKFYPSFVDYIIQPEIDGQVSLYDAAWGQASNRHILGLFSVGKPAKTYGSLNDSEFKNQALKEFDKIFDGQASRTYLKHITQNWSNEPFIKGAYISDYSAPKNVAQLQTPVDNKLYFAGDAYTNGYDWGNVHNAIHSATQSVNKILFN